MRKVRKTSQNTESQVVRVVGAPPQHERNRWCAWRLKEDLKQPYSALAGPQVKVTLGRDQQ
jgi:hypothetical protein